MLVALLPWRSSGVDNDASFYGCVDFLRGVGAGAVADLEIWKGGFNVVGVAHKAAEGGRQRRITRAAVQPKRAL